MLHSNFNNFHNFHHMTTNFQPIDSSGIDLHFFFWSRNDQTSRLIAKSRKLTLSKNCPCRKLDNVYRETFLDTVSSLSRRVIVQRECTLKCSDSIRPYRLRIDSLLSSFGESMCHASCWVIVEKKILPHKESNPGLLIHMFFCFFIGAISIEYCLATSLV